MLWQNPEHEAGVTVGAIDEYNRQRAQQALLTFRREIQSDSISSKQSMLMHLSSIYSILDQQIKQTDAKLQRPSSVLEAQKLQPARKRLKNLQLLLQTYQLCIKQDILTEESDQFDFQDQVFLKGLCNEIFFVLQSLY